MRRLAICFPGDTASMFTAAFHSMVNIKAPPGCEVRWFRGIGWCQARRRTHACEQALEWGAELIAELDIDQVYEPDILSRLVARFDEGYPIVAAMVPLRGYVAASKAKPFQRAAWRSTEGGRAFEPVDPNEGDIQEAEFPTSACVLFSSNDLKRLPKPWYFNKYDPKTWELVAGEDGTFFYRMREQLGVKSYVDTTIRVKHAHVFEIDETYPERFADWAEGSGDPVICNLEGADVDKVDPKQ